MDLFDLDVEGCEKEQPHYIKLKLHLDPDNTSYQ